MPSAEFFSLSQSIQHLKSDLIDFSPNPISPYSSRELLKCQAFVVFSHAEIQVYWEAVSRRILREAENRWTTSSAIDRVIGTLVTYRRPERVSVPTNPRSTAAGSFPWVVEQAIKAHTEAIDNNNGIKRSNVSNLLLPLGVLPGDLLETLLIQLDQTGKNRGDIVHKSSKVSLRNIRDPFSDEISDIDNLVFEIGKFDTALENLGLLSV